MGRRNIDNLSRYARTIEVSPNKTVRAKLNRLGLSLVGDISWPEHVSIFTTPFRVAAQTGIPLIFYGECPQEAYGGPPGADQAQTLTERWRSEYGGFLGLRPSDMVGSLGITERDMEDYLLPVTLDVTAYFLGQFYEWDSHRNIKVAKDAGMEQVLPCEANWWVGENLDNAQTGLHDYFSYLKYGYSRFDAQISVDIRAGLITKKEALENRVGRDFYPSKYMGMDVESILDSIDIKIDEFNKICDNFTNLAIHKNIAV